LTEKHYESLVEALTNNAINTTAASSTPTLSSPQCSCTFPNLANQNDTHWKEESEIYDNCKGDIADWLIVVAFCSAISLISGYVTSIWLTTVW
jgi:hypothetical protein